MKNQEPQEQEMLDLFQVEELEKRYEMGSWSISGTASSTNGGTVSVTGTYTF
jgi:hypothetical protein